MQPSILDACCHAPLRDLPTASGGQPSGGCIFDLAPGGVYNAVNIAVYAVSSCLAISPLPFDKLGAGPFYFLANGLALSLPKGGIFSVALSIASRRPGVTRHHALRCSDFPHCLLRKRVCISKPARLRGPLLLLLKIVKHDYIKPI
jgi:hypothetical protein